MKLIGITGTYGKTSVSEILYQYLLSIGKKTAMYTSNGFFSNGETKKKNYFSTTPFPTELIEHITEEEQKETEYLIVELKSESFLIEPTITEIEFDLTCLVSFHINLFKHYGTLENYIEAKKSVLNMGKIRIGNQDVSTTGDINIDMEVLRVGGQPEYDIFNVEKTFSMVTPYNTELNSDYKTVLENSSLDGLEFYYNDKKYHSNLITMMHMENLSASIAILEELDLFDPDTFDSFIKNIFIRGRMELFKYDETKKPILIDNGYRGIYVLDFELRELVGKDAKLKFIYSPYSEGRTYENNKSRAVLRTRLWDAFPIINSEKTYVIQYEEILSNPEKFGIPADMAINAEEILLEDVLKGREANYEIFEDINSAVEKAIEEIENDEYLVISARTKFRETRKILENIKNNK